MYKSEVCGKTFTDKRNLSRHLKTHQQSKPTHSCSISDQKFNRPDARKRHEAGHSYTISCTECDQYFNRQDSYHRHRLLHSKPDSKPILTNRKRPSETPQPPAKRPRLTEPSHTEGPSDTPQASSEPSLLPEDPETRSLYVDHWNTIRTHESTGNPIQDRFNFTLHGIHPSSFQDMVQSVFVRQSTAFKLNNSFGFILRNVETGELRYFHTSYNNHRFFEVPHLIRNQDDVDRFLTEFSTQDLLEFVRQQRPDTKWIVHLLTNVTFYVNKIQDHVIGK